MGRGPRWKRAVNALSSGPHPGHEAPRSQWGRSGQELASALGLQGKWKHRRQAAERNLRGTSAAPRRHVCRKHVHVSSLGTGSLQMR